MHAFQICNCCQYHEYGSTYEYDAVINLVLGISSWVVYPRFITDFDIFFFQTDNLLLIHHQFLQFLVPMYRDDFHLSH